MLLALEAKNLLVRAALRYRDVVDPATYTPETEKYPIGKAWKGYWQKIEEGSPEHKREIHKEKQLVRRRIHRKIRRVVKTRLRRLCRESEFTTQGMRCRKLPQSCWAA